MGSNLTGLEAASAPARKGGAARQEAGRGLGRGHQAGSGAWFGAGPAPGSKVWRAPRPGSRDPGAGDRSWPCPRFLEVWERRRERGAWVAHVPFMTLRGGGGRTSCGLAPSQTQEAGLRLCAQFPPQRGRLRWCLETRPSRSEAPGTQAQPPTIPSSVTDGVGFPCSLLADTPEWPGHVGGMVVVPALLPGRGVC